MREKVLFFKCIIYIIYCHIASTKCRSVERIKSKISCLRDKGMMDEFVKVYIYIYISFLASNIHIDFLWKLSVGCVV